MWVRSRDHGCRILRKHDVGMGPGLSGRHCDRLLSLPGQLTAEEPEHFYPLAKLLTDFSKFRGTSKTGFMPDCMLQAGTVQAECRENFMSSFGRDVPRAAGWFSRSYNGAWHALHGGDGVRARDDGGHYDTT